MNKQGLNEKIRNRIGRNLYYMSCVVTNDNVRTEFEKNNEILNEIVVGMRQEKSSEDYEKGLNDAWELARKIVSLSPQEGGYSCYDMRDIFGSASLRDISNEFTVQQALAKSQEYEKKKAEEARLTRGDIVRFSIGSSVYNAIFLCEDQHEQCYWVLKENEEFPQRLSKKNFSLIKTGKHIDFDKLFKESRND